jgi:hypothetical protein
VERQVLEQQSSEKSTQLKEILKEITADQIKKLNKILMKSAPQSLTAAIETFVALLKNQERVTSADV